MILERLNGWNAYAKWADSHILRRFLIEKIHQAKELNYQIPI